MPDRVMVTGANGMIGSAVCELLDSLNIEVVRAVRNAAGDKEIGVGDIDSGTNWKNALDEVSTVVHTAARVHKMSDSEGGSEFLYQSVNFEGTLNLARQAVDAGVNRFIFLSTIKVLGEHSKPGSPFTETSAMTPEDAYSRSKAAAEEGLLKIAGKDDMEVVIIRPPLVYGPGVKGNFLKILSWVDRGIPLPLAAIDNKRTLVCLDNLTDFIYTCIRHPGAANQIFLVGDGEDLSTTQLLKRIGDASGKPARLFFIPKTILYWLAGAIGKKSIMERLYGSLQLDISKARHKLGWNPPIAIDDGLRKTVQSVSGIIES